jgi:adenylate cyclase
MSMNNNLKLFLIFTFTVFANLVSFSQQSKTDSLFLAYSNAKNDTTKVNILNDLYKCYQDSAPKKAFKFSNQALELAQKSSFQKGIGSSLNNIGLYYLNSGKSKIALQYFIKANDVFENSSNNRGSAISLANIGYLFSSQDNYKKAIEYYTRSMGAASKAGDTSRVASLLGNIGIIYYNQGFYAMALDIYYKSLRLREKINDKRGIANVLGNISSVFEKQKNIAKSLEYSARSLKIRQEINDKQGIANSLINIGTLYQNTSNSKKALEYYLQALAINTEIGYQEGIASSYINIGDVYKSSENFQKSLDYYSKALKISETIDDKSNTATTLFQIGETFLMSGNKDKALESFKNSITYASEIGAKDILQQNYKSISGIYFQQNDFQNAFKYLSLYSDIKDSIYSEETINQLVDFQTKYETEKQLEEITLLTKETELKDIKLNKGKILIILFLLFAIVSVIFVAFMAKAYRIKKKINNTLVVQNAEILEQKELLAKKRKELEAEKQKSDGLLLNILPYDTAEELKAYGRSTAKQFENVSVMFTDFVDFTVITEQLPPETLVNELNRFFIRFDEIVEKYNVEKIKTIGDAYMCAAGLPVSHPKSVINCVKAAMEFLHFVEIENKNKIKNNEMPWKIRIGIHTGDVIAGVVGKKKFAYDIWGDTVNIASRIETSGEEGKINISETTYQLVQDHFNCTYRGRIAAKNKDTIEMYFVDGLKKEKVVFQEGFFPS